MILRGQSGAWQGYLADLVENELRSEHLEQIVASFWMVKFVASWVSVKGAGTGSNIIQLVYGIWFDRFWQPPCQLSGRK
jgi:hypothetical protein